ncbi:MAG: hypothetical protein IJX99_08050 [Clostridia bacterium]|nr:hypothetical protein [Clostridia bacterium]
MKIYFIDKTGKNGRIAKEIKARGYENVEIKNTYSFKSTKSDYVILSEYNKYDKDNDLLCKYNNLIIVSKDIDQNTIYDYIKNYKVIDIITGKATDEYIAERITKSFV